MTFRQDAHIFFEEQRGDFKIHCFRFMSPTRYGPYFNALFYEVLLNCCFALRKKRIKNFPVL